MKIEVRKLNPETMEPDESGIEYRITTLDSGSIAYEVIGTEEMQLPTPFIDPQTAANDAIMSGLIDVSTQQAQGMDAIISGQIDTATQSANANDAIMNAMIDIQAQLDEIKTKLGVV